MSIAFRDSERSTVGLEWEVQIVDPKTLQLAHNAKWILAEVRRRGCSLVKGEMHQNMLEFVSRKRVSVAECAADMEEAIDAALPYAEELGVGLSGGGSHPFAHPSDQPVSETARYKELVERTRYWGRQMVIFGTSASRTAGRSLPSTTSSAPKSAICSGYRRPPPTGTASTPDTPTTGR